MVSFLDTLDDEATEETEALPSIVIPEKEESSFLDILDDKGVEEQEEVILPEEDKPTTISAYNPSFFEKMKTFYKDPAAEGAKATQALVDAEIFEMSPSNAFRLREVLDRNVKYSPEALALRSSRTQTVVDSINRGYVTVENSQWYARYRAFDDSDEVWEGMKRTDEYLNQPMAIPETMLEQALADFGNMAPSFAEGFRQGAWPGLALAGGAAAAGAVTGTFPEVAPVLPSLYAVGQTYGSLKFMNELAGGLAFKEMINYRDPDTDEQIDPAIARLASYGVGALTSLSDMVQMKTLVKTVPGGKKFLARVMNDTLKDLASSKTLIPIASKYAQQYGKTIVTETAQELVQESVMIVGDMFAKHLTNELNDTDLPMPEIKDITDRLNETMMASARAFAVMGLPGAISSTGYDVAKQRKLDKATTEAAQIEIDVEDHVEQVMRAKDMDELQSMVAPKTEGEYFVSDEELTDEAPELDIEAILGDEAAEDAFISKLMTDAGFSVPVTKTEQGIKDFADRIEAVESLTSPEDRQFYIDNAEAIDAELAQRIENIPASIGTAAKNDGLNAATQINETSHGNDVQYNGEMDLSELGRPNLYQFTAHSGPAKGATFTVTELTQEAVQAKLDQMIALREDVPGAVGEVVQGEPLTDAPFPSGSVQTGKPMKFYYLHNKTSSPDMGAQFAQDIEPHGKYISAGGSVELTGPMKDMFEQGTVEIKNPLVLDHKTTRHGGWKTDLSNMYDGKTGKDLSNAAQTDGYDAIITVDDGKISESVLLAPPDVPGAVGEVDQIQTPEFKEWFGDSKVVDKNGKPLVVYHGTPDSRFLREDGVFKSEAERYGGYGDTTGVHWFTQSKATADTYADDRRAFDYQHAEPAIVPAYLMLENPLIIDGRGENWRSVQARGKTSNVIDEAIQAGHDGVIIRNVKDDYNNTASTQSIDTYSVFESTQIKSATENVGTFDPTDPSIYAAVGPTKTPTIAQPFHSSKIEHQGLKESVESGLLSTEEGAIIDGVMEILGEKGWGDYFDVKISGQKFTPSDTQLEAHGIPKNKAHLYQLEGALLTEKAQQEIKDIVQNVAVIFQGGDVTTFFHEFGEFAYKRLLTDKGDKATVSNEHRASGSKQSENEWFSDNFRDWWVKTLAGDSDIVSPELHTLYQKMVSIIKEVWQRIKSLGTPTPAIDKLFTDIIRNGRKVEFGAGKIEDVAADIGKTYNIKEIKTKSKKDSGKRWSVEIGEAFKAGFGGLIKDIQSAEPGGKTFTEAEVGGGSDVGGFGTTYLEFMTDKGWTGDQVENALKKAIDEKPLGITQVNIVESAIEYLDEMERMMTKSDQEMIEEWGEFFDQQHEEEAPVSKQSAGLRGYHLTQKALKEQTGQVLSKEDAAEQEMLRYALKKASFHARKAHSEGNKAGVIKEKKRMAAILARAKKRKADAADIKKVKSKIAEELKKTKVTKQSGKPKGRYGAEKQVTLDTMRGWVTGKSRLTKAQARYLFADRVQKLADAEISIPSEFELIENKLLSMIGAPTTDIALASSVLADIKALKEAGSAEVLRKAQNRIARNEQTIEDFIRIIGDVDAGKRQIGGKGRPEDKALKQRIRNLLFASGGTNFIQAWDDLLDILSYRDKDSKPGESAISKFGNVHDQENIEKLGNMNAMESLQKIVMDTYGLKNTAQMTKMFDKDSEQVDLGTFKDLNDNPVQMVFTKAEGRKAIMALLDPSLYDTFFSEKGEMHWSQDMVSALYNMMTPQDMEFIQAQMKWYQDYYTSINDVYKEIYGVNLPSNPFYSPISREGVNKEEDSGLGEFMKDAPFRASASGQGSIKSRTVNYHAISQQSDISVLMRHVMEMEHFKAWSQKIRDLNAVFNHPDVRASIAENFGQNINQHLEETIQALASGGNDRSNMYGALDKIRIRYTQSVLAIKPSLFIKQLSSTFAYADAIPVTYWTKEFAKMLVPANYTKAVKELMGQSVTFKRRWEQGGMERDIAAAIKTDEYKAFKANPSFINKLMFMVRLGDAAAIVAGGYPVYKYYLEKTGSKEQAIRHFESVTSSTQQSSDLSKLSSWQRGNAIMKLFTMFKTSPTSYLRKEVAAVRNLSAGRISKTQFMKTIIIYHFVLPLVFQTMSEMVIGDDDDDGLLTKGQKRAMFLGSLNGYFIIGDGLDYMLKKMLGIYADLPTVAPNGIWRDLMKAIRLFDWNDLSSEEVLSAVRGLAGASGGATGLPGKQVVDIGTGISDVLAGEWERGIMEMMGWSPTIAEKATEDL